MFTCTLLQTCLTQREQKLSRAGLAAVSCLSSGYIWILVSNWNEIECNLFNINSKPYFQKSLLARINVLWQALRLCQLNQNLLKGSAEKKVIISKELGPQKDKIFSSTAM